MRNIKVSCPSTKDSYGVMGKHGQLIHKGAPCFIHIGIWMVVEELFHNTMLLIHLLHRPSYFIQ